MWKKIVWLVISCLIVAALLLVSCAPAAVEDEETVVTPEEEEVVIKEEEPASTLTSKIAFSSELDGNYEIYVMDADGSNQTRLTDNPEPDWSP